LLLNPNHYESRRLRAFTYYASRKYEKMKDDALLMIHSHPKDPLGYSLRAIAWRELGKYGEAVAEYENAMALTPKEDAQYIDLVTQRCETLLRMGDYQRIIAETSAEANDVSPLHYHLFCALTAVGEYGKASSLSRRIISPSHEARKQLRDWCAKYVFDTLAAGRSWHPVGPTPAGAVFLPMVEAEETYHLLAAKGRRLTADGFSAAWSPDGKKLAFSLGVQGRSGIALFDPATKETDLLIVPGKYSRWSPDGRYIAFVRDRQFLSVPEFVAADPKNEQSAVADQEVWLMNSDGTKPRRLVRGVWPSWSWDSTCVYYRSPADSTLYSISITGEAAKPKKIMACPGSIPSVSSDNQRVAYMERMSLKVQDLASQKLVAEWPLPVPSAGWGASAWSPTGSELCLGGSGGLANRTGLWIYRLDQIEPAKTLSGPVTVGSWSPDGTKLVFELGAPHFEIWTADRDPNASTVESLGPARTSEEHLRDVIVFHTRRIEADPLDAYAYSDRASCYDCLHDRAQANADIKRWSAAASGQLPWYFRRVISMPFNCELVFSAERPVNEILVLSVAFGQKGKCDMKVFEIPTVVMSLLGFGLLSSVAPPPARADFTFGAPMNLGPNTNTSAWDDAQSMTADGLSMFFGTTRVGGGVKYDIFVMTRETLEDDWGAPVDLGSPVNMVGIMDMTPAISADGLTLVFDSDRPDGSGLTDIYMTTRETKDSPWAVPANLGPLINSPDYEVGLCLSADTLELYFGSMRSGGVGRDRKSVV
jgi:Tol biopolymer transport system component